MVALTYSNGPLTANFALIDQPNTWTATQDFNSTVNFNGAVDFASNVTIQGNLTSINSLNINLGDNSGDIVFGYARIRFYNNALDKHATFDMQNLTTNRTFKFPDFGGGTIAILERANTWSAIQTFSSPVSITDTGATAFQCAGQAQFQEDVQLGVVSTDAIFIIGTPDFYNTASSASAGGQTLPANPAGFLTIKVSGVAKKVPYYNN